MKAEDTVMPLEFSALDGLHCVGISDTKILRSLREQASISFKAGVKEVIDFIVDHKRGYYARPDGTISYIISACWTEEEWKALIREDEGIDLH